MSKYLYSSFLLFVFGHHPLFGPEFGSGWKSGGRNWKVSGSTTTTGNHHLENMIFSSMSRGNVSCTCEDIVSQTDGETIWGRHYNVMPFNKCSLNFIHENRISEQLQTSGALPVDLCCVRGSQVTLALTEPIKEVLSDKKGKTSSVPYRHP